MTYWDEMVHPAELPIVAREAWHRDAFDQEQHELYWLAQSHLRLVTKQELELDMEEGNGNSPVRSTSSHRTGLSHP